MIKKDEKLPEGYIQKDNKFYKGSDDSLTTEEMEKLLLLKQAEDINSIKHCAIYFTTLSVISLIIGFIIIFAYH